jgi:hypothetical protein
LALLLALRDRTAFAETYKSLLAFSSRIKKENLDKQVAESVENPSSFLMVHFGVPERIALLQSIASDELSKIFNDEQLTYISSLEVSSGESEVEAIDQNIE